MKPLALVVLVALPAVAAMDAVSPTIGAPLEFKGPKILPNLSIEFAPRVRDAEREIAHEGEEYLEARREWEEGPAPDTAEQDRLWKAIGEAYGKRLALRRQQHQGRLQPEAATQAVAGWRSLGPTNQGGRVNKYAFTPDGSKLYVATTYGGIWVLTRQGGPGSDYGNPRSLTDDLPLLSYGAIAIAPSNPHLVYASTGEGTTSLHHVPARGMLRSTDGGETWALSPRITNYSYALDVNPQDPNDVLLAAAEGVFRSRDGARTFTLKMASTKVAGQRTPINFARRSDDPRVVWAGLWGGIAVSRDGGETWSVYFEDLAQRLEYTGGKAARSEVAISPSNPNRMYWLVGATIDTGGDSQIGILRSDDGGTNWNVVLGQQSAEDRVLGSQQWSCLSIAVDPTNPDRVIVGGLDTWRTEDGGAHWMKISQWTLPEHHPQFCHADIRSIVFEPGLASYWVGSDGGLFRSVDSGRSYASKNEGIVTRLFTSLAQHPTDPYRIYAGSQDNGTNVLTANNAAAWKEIHGGDGFDCVVNQKNPNTVYVTYYNSYVERADDGGADQSSFRDVTCPPEATAFEQCPMHPITTFRSRLGVDPVDPGVLYVVTDRLYRTSDGANQPTDWEPVYPGYFCRDGYSETPCANTKAYASCTALSVNPRSGAQVAFGTGQNRDKDESVGKLYYTVDGFGHSYYLNVGAQVNAIAWDPTTPNAVYIGLETAQQLGDATAEHSLYRVTNLDSNPVFVPADSGLSMTITYATTSSTFYLPVDSLAVSPKDGKLVFAGTKFGIYRSTDAGASWSEFGTDLPAVWVAALLFTPDGSKIRAGTWGRGLWEANPLGGAVGGGTPPNAAFTFSPSAPRPGQTVTFQDQSSNGASAWSWNFGDGATSAAQNPTHVYTNPGNYLVSLTVSNAAGSKNTVKFVNVSYGTTGGGNVYTYLLPAVVSAAGAGGAAFDTEVTLTNRAARPVDLTFRTAGALSGSATYRLPPGQQIVPEIFGFLAAHGLAVPPGSKVTSLRIEVAGADNLSQFGALARVTTPATPGLKALGIAGRFGLSFTALPLGRGAKDRAVIYGLQQTADPPSPGTRSNVACVHAGGGSGGPIGLEITYRDGDSGIDHPSKTSVTLQAFQFWQENQPLASRGMRSAFATVRKVAGDGQFVCYAALNDNVTGDGAYQPMVIDDEPSTTPTAVVPVVLDTDSYRSEATLANRTDRPISGVFAVVPAGNPTPQWGTFTIDPGTQFTVPNLFETLRGVGFDIPHGTVASLVFELLDGTFDPNGNRPPGVPTSEGFLGIRTYTTRASGKIGLAYGYSPLGSSADTQAFVYGLQQTGVRGKEGGTRSNLAVVHALGGQVEDLTLDVTYFGPDGRELGKEPACGPCTLKPGEWRQFNTPLERFGVPNGWARVTRVAGSDQFLTYGVLNDQASDDGSYVPMVVP